MVPNQRLLCIIGMLSMLLLMPSCFPTNPAEEELNNCLISSASSLESISQTSSTSVRMVEPLRGGVYPIEPFGFQLVFPESWRNYYVIEWVNNKYTDSGNFQCLRISFYGESNLSHDYDEISNDRPIPLFYICTEEYKEARGGGIAAVQKIGSVKGMNYYKFRQTDYPIDYLNPEGQRDLSTDEMAKVQRDYDKAQQMENDIESIIQSFKPL